MSMHQIEQMINKKAQQATQSFMSAVQQLSCEGISQEHQLQSLRTLGIEADEETLESYLKKLADLKFDHIFLINKFLETPIDTLIHGLKNKSEQDVRKYYKQVVIILHPDKNVHPKATEAFQKIAKAVDESEAQRRQYNGCSR